MIHESRLIESKKKIILISLKQCCPKIEWIAKGTRAFKTILITKYDLKALIIE